jgi:hypothetical protein
MTTPSKRIYEAAGATQERARQIQLLVKSCPQAIREALPFVQANQLDEIIKELDREHQRRAEWETWMELRMHELEEHPAVSVPPLTRFEIADPGPGRYDFDEEGDG